MQTHTQHARLNTYHGPKRQLLGNQSGQAPPAWRNGITAPGQSKRPSGSTSTQEGGSKILLSRLPADVTENEVEVLFTRTVGPVKDAFIIYNSQGLSKGMAVVTFQRPGDATVARTKYNGKIIDGRRPIKIEIIVDTDDASSSQAKVPSQPQIPSLLARISGVKSQVVNMSVTMKSTRAVAAKKNGPVVPAPAPIVFNPAPRAVKHNPKRRLRAKKPAKRLKRAAVTVADLDKEMEDYRAGADAMTS